MLNSTNLPKTLYYKMLGVKIGNAHARKPKLDTLLLS